MRIGLSIFSRSISLIVVIFLLILGNFNYLFSPHETENTKEDLPSNRVKVDSEHIDDSQLTNSNMDAPKRVENDYPKNSPLFNTRSNNNFTKKTWLMFKNTADRRSTSTSNIPGTPTAPPKVLWTNKTSTTYSSPVVGYNKVYLTTTDGQIFCFEETTGKLRWNVKLTSDKYSSLSTPALASEHLVVYSSYEKAVYRLNAYSGILNWTFKIPNSNTTFNKSYINQPMLVYDGNVLFGDSNRYFYCLNESNGSVIWSYKTQEGLTYDYGIIGGAAATENMIFFGACDGYIYCMDLNGFLDGNQGLGVENKTGSFDGDVIWKYYTGDSISSVPVIYDKYVYITVGVHNSSFGDRDIYKIYCLDRNNGTLYWDFTTEDHIISSPAIAEDRVIFGGLDNKLYCLNTEDNTSYWLPYNTINEIWSSPAIASGKIVFGTLDSKLYCLYSHNGQVVWTKDLDKPIFSSPALANDRIYICSESGKLYAIGPPDTVQPLITKTTPKEDEVDVPISSYFTVKFNEALCIDSITKKNIILHDSQMELVPIDFTYDDSSKTITIKPTKFLKITSKYRITITSGIKDCAGNNLDGNMNNLPDGSPNDDYIWTFNTSSNHPPELSDPKVTPKFGTLGTKFTFTVLYTDQDNNPPGLGNKDIFIYFDDKPEAHQMRLNDTPDSPKKWHNNNYKDSEQFIFKTKLNAMGIHSFRIWCNDGTDWNETIIQGVPIIPGPPEIKTIPELSVDEDIELILNLTNYLDDPDTPLNELDIKVNSSFATVDSSQVKFLYPNSFTYPDGNRYDYINISVTDNEYFTSTEIKIWVNQVNDPPIIRPIPNLLIVEKNYFNINLQNYVSDEDNLFNELNITIDSDLAEIDKDKNFLRIYYPTETEKDVIYLNASDGEYWTIAEITVKVVSSDIPFVIYELPNLNVMEDIKFILNISGYLILRKSSITDLEINCSSNFAEVNGLEIIFLYTDSFNYPSGKTHENVKITVRTKNLDYTQTQQIKVMVTSINDAPKLLNGIVSPEVGNITQEFTFEVNYFDVDESDEQKVYVVLDETSFEMRKISGQKTEYPGARYSFTLEIGIGNHFYYFICDDGSSAPNNKFSTKIKSIFVTGNLDPYFSHGHGLDPEVVKTLDLDGDGIPGYWEIQYNMDPFNGSDALEDFDGDNFKNYIEYLGHDGLPTGNDSTNPLDPKDKLKIESESEEKPKTTYAHWQVALILIGVIIIGMVIIYSLFSARGVGLSVRIPKIMMSPKVSGEHPYTERLDGESESELDEDDSEISEIEEDEEESRIIEDDLEIIDIDLDSEDVDSDATLPLEVDLTEEDKPFLESEEVFDEELDEVEPEGNEVDSEDESFDDSNQNEMEDSAEQKSTSKKRSKKGKDKKREHEE